MPHIQIEEHLIYSHVDRLDRILKNDLIFHQVKQTSVPIEVQLTWTTYHLENLGKK